MRNWLFHPIVFYPLVILLAALAIGLSLQPQSWPRAPAPVAGQIQNGALILEREAFNSPEKPPEQVVKVERDTLGHPLALDIAVLPNQPAPTPSETGVRILLTPQSAALIGDKGAHVDIVYHILPVSTAAALAVSLQGSGPADWVSKAIPAQNGALSYDLPPGFSTNAIGLRAIASAADQNYGVEIVRIRVLPHD
jgi:hypothetical protein